MRQTAFLLLLSTSLLFSLVYTPRIKINDQVDLYSLETIIQGIIKPGMTDAQKAEAVWRFILAHNFHYAAPEEGLSENGNTFEMNIVEDPLKLLNVYGYSYCFSNTSMTTRLWQAAGLSSTRIWGIGGHQISEVFYDSAWHHYDADQSVSAYFLKDDGKTVASIEDLVKKGYHYIISPKFKSNPQMPYDDNPVYEHESRKVLADFFTSKDDNYLRDQMSISVHRMDYYLKRHETLTLFHTAQGRWRHASGVIKSINPGNGPFDAHGDRTYGNGLFEYRPDLTDSTVLSEGFLSSGNLRCNGTLTLSDPSLPGEGVVKVLSPWIITGTPLSPSITKVPLEKYYGAAILTGHLNTDKSVIRDSVALEIRISTDKMFGAWQTVYRQTSSGYFNLDLSEWLSQPTYYYSLKILLRDNAVKKRTTPSLDNLCLKTWVQLNPASLPHLVPGDNKIVYSADGPAVDKVDLERGSIPNKPVDYVYASSNLLVDASSPKKRFVQKDSTRPATVIFELAAQEGLMSDYYAVFLLDMRSKMRALIEHSESDTLHFQKLPLPEKKYHDHWADWYSQCFTPATKLKKAYFRVTLAGGAALDMFNCGYRYPWRAPSGRISVVQAAEVDGALKEFTWDFADKKGVINLSVQGKNVVNKYLKYICK